MPYSNEYVKKEEQSSAPTSTTKVEQQWSVWDYPPAPNQGPGTPLATPVATPSTTPATTPANSMYSGSTRYPASTQYTPQSTPGVSPAASTYTDHSSSANGWNPSQQQAAPAAPVHQQKRRKPDYRDLSPEPAPNTPDYKDLSPETSSAIPDYKDPNHGRKRAKPNYSDW